MIPMTLCGPIGTACRTTGRIIDIWKLAIGFCRDPGERRKEVSQRRLTTGNAGKMRIQF